MKNSVLLNAEHFENTCDTKINLILGFDGVTMLDIVGTAEVYSVANDYVLKSSSRNYRTVIASTNGAPIKSWSGLVINSVDRDTIDPRTIDTIIVPGGGPPNDPPIPQDVVEYLKLNAHHARRICAICTGTFILAAAGLTRGKNVTTHWSAADSFRRQFPHTDLDVESIFTKDGNIWSSAGFTAGLDMALALLQEDEGYDTSISMARLLVMYLKRSEGQAQFSEPLSAQLAGGEGFSQLHSWIANNLTQNLTVDRMAEQVRMTPRTFARKYQAQLGYTPAKMVSRFKLDAACSKLIESNLSLKVIASETGYKDEQNMRRAFKRHLSVGPSEYRSRFSKAV